MEHLKNTHDLRLPSWGPYTKKYAGVSHITDQAEGIRFDLSVFPGFYRRKVDVPNVMWESGFHPWEAAADLSYYSFRHELEWKDRVYCDISYSAMSDDSILIRCECVNRTDMMQNIVMNYMASIHFPQVQSHGKTLQPGTVKLPEGAVWHDALDYTELTFAVPRPADQLVYDGLFRGEKRGQAFIGGSCLGTGFGKNAGDTVTYRLQVHEPMREGAVLFRYRMDAGHSVTLKLSLNGVTHADVPFEGSPASDLQNNVVRLGALAAGEYDLILTSLGGSPVELDGFVLTEWELADGVVFSSIERNHTPQISEGPRSNSLLLKYEHTDRYYGLLWDFDSSVIREFHCGELNQLMRHTVHHHVRSVFKGDGEGHYTNVFLRPILVNPQSATILFGMVCSGSRDEVEACLLQFDGSSAQNESVYEAARSKTVDFTRSNHSGESLRLSQRLMAATSLTNVVFPVYTKRSYIRHNTPGRWWDCLYTWDSGFIGLGLAEMDLNRAIDCLNAYVTEPGDPHAAFIHHGSMVPVQHYLFHELWNKTQSKELLRYFYPRLRQYYLFYCGKTGGSTTRTLKSGLIKTWDYFYNSGGWDDYPPQVHVHRQKMQQQAAPVSNTAHGIRIAKILSMAALALGDLEDDVEEYEQDIAQLTDALQKYAWDAESGYYGYVCHDAEGRPEHFLKHSSGCNYNMGLDGAYPLVAGICDTEQEKQLLDRLADGSRLWSEIGLSAVDQSAPYYKHDGYWNGAVWMPHQWFFWKTMLDAGKPSLAHRIARTGLDVWKREVEATYNCYEHFSIESGRGAGWHQFGGLSTPVLCWFGAYHMPGTLTCGFDVWIREKAFSGDATSLDATLSYFGAGPGQYSVIVCMQPGYSYKAAWDGRELPMNRLDDGVFELNLPRQSGGNLHVERVGSAS